MRVLWWTTSVLVISSLTTLSFSLSSFYSTEQCSGFCISQQRSFLLLVSFPVPTPGLCNYWYTDSLRLLFMPSVIKCYVENRYVTMDVLLCYRCCWNSFQLTGFHLVARGSLLVFSWAREIHCMMNNRLGNEFRFLVNREARTHS